MDRMSKEDVRFWIFDGEFIEFFGERAGEASERKRTKMNEDKHARGYCEWRLEGWRGVEGPKVR